jgi:hypothetical protein
MNTLRWKTEQSHNDNNVTMLYYLENINETLDITYVDGTYAEGVNEEGVRYEIHVSGDGDSFNHKIEFVEI